jgi:methionine aminopeptidase
LSWSADILVLLVILCLYFLQNKDVTEAIQKVAAAYDCKIVEGVLSHQLKQFVIDGNKVVLSVSNADTKVDDAEFEENEVYAIDIVTSTGEGKVII